MKIHFDGNAAAPRGNAGPGFASCGAAIVAADWPTRTTNDTTAVTCGACARTGEFGIWHGRQAAARRKAEAARA